MSVAVASSSSSEGARSVAVASSVAVARSSSSAGNKAISKPPDSSVSDLLIHYRGSFFDWLRALRKKAGETLDEKCERSVLGAQVNCWQVLASRKLPPTSDGRPRLPSDVTKIVFKFLGPVMVSDGFKGFSDTIQSRVEAARARDRYRAMEYYAELFRKAADTGADEFEITQEIFDAAPRSSLDKPIHPALVAHYFSRVAGLTVWVGPQRTQYWDEVVEPASRYHEEKFRYGTDVADYLPLRARLHDVEETAVNKHVLANMAEMMQKHTAPGVKGSRYVRVPPRGLVSFGTAQMKFAETANAAAERAAEYVISLAVAHFAQGNTRFLLTEELWQAAPKMPNGQLPLLWPKSVSQRNALQFAGGSHALLERLKCVLHEVDLSCQGIRMRSTSAETGEWGKLPVELSMH